MSFTFYSEKHFNQATFALSRHIKPMKLGTLRYAFAKSAGFDSVNSFRIYLNQQELLALPEPEYEWARLPHDPYKSIQRVGRHLIIERSIGMSREDFASVEGWQKGVRHVFGSSKVSGLSERTIDNKVYASGHINLFEQHGYQSVLHILHSFLLEEAEAGCARYVLFDKIFNGISMVFHHAAEIPLAMDYPRRAPALSDGLQEVYERIKAQQIAFPALSDFQGVVDSLSKHFLDFIPLTDFDLAVSMTIFKCKDVSQAKNDLFERSQKLFKTAINEILSYHCVNDPKTAFEFFYPVGEVFDYEGSREMLEAAFYLNLTISQDEEFYYLHELEDDQRSAHSLHPGM